MKTWWTPEEDEILRREHGKLTVEQLYNLLPDRSRSAIKNRRNTLGLRLDDTVRAERSTIGQFKKGNIPFTKGKKQTDYMSNEAIEKTKIGHFRKGWQPRNTKFDGAESLRIEVGTQRKYLYIRLQRNKWVEKHRLIWEQEHGKIAPGYNIVFKDGNTLNCTIENLECISDAEIMARNTIRRFPIEVQETIHALHKLKNRIKKYEKQDD